MLKVPISLAYVNHEQTNINNKKLKHKQTKLRDEKKTFGKEERNKVNDTSSLCETTIYN